MKRSPLAILLLAATALAAAPLEPGWGREPVETASPGHGRISLNGLWRFAPDASLAEPDTDSPEWGLIHVPGAWANRHWNMRLGSSISQNGAGERWQDVDWQDLRSAWYARPVTVPADWAGSEITLEVTRLSTDAVVYANGQRVGEIHWPGGEVDLNGLLPPGQISNIALQVYAADTAEEAHTALASGENPSLTNPSRLFHSGLIGEVFLNQRPVGPRVEDVFVKTSVRKQELALAVTLVGLGQAEDLHFTVCARDAQGRVAFEAKAQQHVDPASGEPVELAWHWEDPMLWDFDEPNLYTLELTVTGKDWADTVLERFGFREFWTQGRDLVLNGRPVKLRPILAKDGDAAGNVENIRRHIRRYLKMGYNVAELWPVDHQQRGTGHFQKLWLEIADEEGLGLIAVLPRSNAYILNDDYQVDWDNDRERYREDVQAELIQFRNHPSALAWVNSNNFLGHAQDLNPRRIGRASEVNPGWQKRADAGAEAIAIIKEADPTRPVASHHGAHVGDLYTTNVHLNFLPLQDREEWLSDYTEHGTMPFMAVEMGTPLHCSFMRGRNPYHQNILTEPWMTEFAAIYLGPEAYASEPANYREDIVATFKEGQKYERWQSRPSMIEAPAFQELQQLFTRNTYRSWRTWGNAGGMIAWADGHGWSAGPGYYDNIPSAEPFQAGHRGTWLPSAPRRKSLPLDESSGWRPLPAGDTLLAHLQPTLAWIAGAPGAFTEKSHHFPAGGQLDKQAVLINDKAVPLLATLDWTVNIDGETIARESLDTTLRPGEIRFVPIRARLPEVLAKTDGTIHLSASIGETQHEDTFPFRVFPSTDPVTVRAQIIDPRGLTRAMLKAAEVDLRLPEANPPNLFIIGRQALAPGETLPAAARATIQSGGTVLIMGQDRAWYECTLGFRVAAPIARRAYPVQPDHPAIRGLDANDLRDWNGEATLVDPYPDLEDSEVAKGSCHAPEHGWRWGSRGAVSSAMLEKPHYSGWTPILEGEFDLAYSPLLELNVAGGRVILCTLDLEDQVPGDPAATQLARQLVAYAADSSPLPRRNTFYLGNERDMKWLKRMGLVFTAVDTIPAESGLLLVGNRSGLDAAQITTYAERGGNVLVLPQRHSSDLIELAEDAAAGTFAEVPAWPEAAGLSVSELRTRAPVALKTISGKPPLETAAHGLLGRQATTDGGSIIFCQLDPAALRADQATYLRFTRWRFHRAIAQLAANLGATFRADTRALSPTGENALLVDLAGPWQYAMLETVPGSDSQPQSDPGISDEANRIGLGETPMPGITSTTDLPGLLDDFGEVDGEAIFQRTFELPASLIGQDLVLRLGSVDDNDVTYINGYRIGETKGWTAPRIYPVPANILRAGENVITVRVWDNFGPGGFNGRMDDLFLGLPGAYPPRSPYHPDYIDDFDLGDDPYRYFRW